MNNAQHIVCTLTASMLTEDPVTLVYTDGDGVTSIRYVVVSKIEKCANGIVAVRVYDLARKGPRCFRLSRIVRAEDGLRDVAVTL